MFALSLTFCFPLLDWGVCFSVYALGDHNLLGYVASTALLVLTLVEGRIVFTPSLHYIGFESCWMVCLLAVMGYYNNAHIDIGFHLVI